MDKDAMISCQIINENGAFSASVYGEEGWPLYMVLEHVVIPALRGAGYSEETIAKRIDTDPAEFGNNRN